MGNAQVYGWVAKGKRVRYLLLSRVLAPRAGAKERAAKAGANGFNALEWKQHLAPALKEKR